MGHVAFCAARRRIESVKLAIVATAALKCSCG